MIQHILRAFVKKCFPEYYEELLQDEHEQYLLDIGFEKDSLAFNILKDRESYVRYIETGSGRVDRLIDTTQEV